MPDTFGNFAVFSTRALLCCHDLMRSTLNRLQQKWNLIDRYVASVSGTSDWPAVLLLSVLRTRPARGSSIWARLIRMLFPRVYIRPRLLNGLQIGLNPASLDNFVIYEELFVESIYDLSTVRFQPDTVIDCGAYEGYFTLLAKARFSGARLLAFEPQPENYAGLVHNLSLNDLKVDTHREAVSVAAGQMPFSGEGCSGHLGSDLDSSDRVTVSNLCEVIANTATRRLLLKLDVEGEEEKILPALLSVLPATCAIFFEWHHGLTAFLQTESSLNKAGFEVSCCRRRKLSEDAELIDAFAQRFGERELRSWPE
jgi:FkbM family methyltransferase